MKNYLILFLLWFPIFGSYSANDIKHEIRGVWLTTNWGLDWPKTAATNEHTRRVQQESLCRILDEMERLNLNVVFFQARIRGDVAYNSQYEPYNPVFAGKSGRSPGYDPLRFVIEECHKRGLECHAWIVCMPIGTVKANKDAKQNSLVYTHPELCLRLGNEWYLNPGEPRTANYLADIAEEIIRNYDVDGIHLDYIRYPDDPTLFPDSKTYSRYGASYHSISTWRRENINKIVATINSRVKTVAPHVKLSSAVIGKYASLPHVKAGWSGIESVSQDAAYWLRNNQHDFIAPMMYYTRHFDDFLENWQQHSYGHPVVAGLGAYQVDVPGLRWSYPEILNQIESSRKKKSGGVAYFRWENIDAKTRLNSFVKNMYYPHKALFPELPGDDPVSVFSPQNLVEEKRYDGTYLKWENVPNAMGYVVYGSDNYPVDITDAGNILGVVVRGTEYRLPRRAKYTTVTAYNRRHKESLPVTVSSTVGERQAVGMYDNETKTIFIDKRWWGKTIKILNLQGRILYSDVPGDNLCVSFLPEGVYVMKIIDRNTVETKKLEIKK